MTAVAKINDDAVPLQPEPEREPQQKEEEVTVTETAEPLAISASGRVRRSIQKFGFEQGKTEEEEEFTPPVGPGTKLRDMDVIGERIAALGKKDAETIKSLYNIMYGRRFQQKNMKAIKEHILEFSGIPDAVEKTHQQLTPKIGRWMRKYLQDVMDLLGVDRSKKSFDEEEKAMTKESLITRLIEWLCNPHEAQGLKRKGAADGAKKKKTKKSTKTTGTKRKSSSATKTSTKKAKTTASKKKKSAPVVEESDSTESEKENESDTASGDESSSDFEEKMKTTKKKASQKPRVSRTTQLSDLDEDESENVNENGTDKDETSGLDADVRQKVKDIIAKGDAEELTVKKIVRQASEECGKDLFLQKAAIKEFITHLQM